jgi:hypothetical protein
MAPAKTPAVNHSPCMGGSVARNDSTFHEVDKNDYRGENGSNSGFSASNEGPKQEIDLHHLRRAAMLAQ